MKPALFYLTIFLSILQFRTEPAHEQFAAELLNELNKVVEELSNEKALASWNFVTNITDHNAELEARVNANFARKLKKISIVLKQFPWETYKNERVRRQFEKMSVLGWPALPMSQFTKLIRIVSEMQGIYSRAKVCSYRERHRCDLSLEPDINEIMEKSKDPDELSYYWDQWRRVSGKRIKNLFIKYVFLSNWAANLNGFANNKELWIKDYETDDFEQQIATIWQQLRPLYKQIHAYVRYKLRLKYGEKIVPYGGLIPAHLLGNIWSQSWSNIYDIVIPYPDEKSPDITLEMHKQKYTVLKMFRMADEFFQSINLTAMPDLFWKNSIIEKPKDREIVCHASAWDMQDGKDFRIKQCTQVNEEDFFTVHHEMGHIQYFLQYKDQPVSFRRGANPGFQEAVGDVISLSVTTDKHLHRIGLLKYYKDSERSTINTLMQVGLNKIAFLPFALVTDFWRWDVFSGRTAPRNYNSAWWSLREEYQGIQAPTARTEGDFDPGAKFHVAADIPYIRYFVSFIIQFQFHKALCIEAGQYEPDNPRKALHKCDIFESVNAGNALGRMLKLGSSKPWQQAMKTLTGTDKMNASALLEYFRPLEKWLEKENLRNGERVGWKRDYSNYL